MQKRFVSWAAVSSLPQAKKISVDDQLKTNLEHIEQWGGILVAQLPVRGKSRSIVTWEKACATISEYAALRDMIAQRAFDVLIYLDRSRLGRKASLIDTIVELCQEAGIATYETESPPSSLEPEGHNFGHKLVGAVKSLIAQEEVVKMQHRHEMGMAARVRNGDFPGRVPYGWTVRYEIEDDKPLQIVEVDEEAKSAIETIFALYLDNGASVKTITETLTKKGVTPPRGSAWTPSAVTVIISLAWRYAGYVELNARSKQRPYVRAKSRWPALITEEIAKAATTERNRRAHAKRSVDRSVHRFSQIVWCKKCERRMIARYSWRESRRDKTQRKRIENYRCMTNGEPSHAKFQIAGHYLTDVVRHAIEYVQDENNREEVLGAYSDRTPQIERNIAKAKARLAKLEQDMQRADDAYVIGKMNLERYKRQVDRLDEQAIAIYAEIATYQEELEEEVLESQRETRLLEIAGEGLFWLDSDDLPTANAWFRRHIKIWVNNEDAERRVIVEYL